MTAFNVTDFSDKVENLLATQNSLLIILNTPAHNPTGYALSSDEWDKVIEILKSKATKNKKISLLVDIAYIDFAAEKSVAWSFIDKFGDSIGRKGPADVMLYFRQFLAVSVSRRTGCIDKPFYTFVTGCDKHVQEAVDVVAVCSNRIVYASGDAAKSSLLKHGITVLDRFPASVQVTDVSFDKTEVVIPKERLDVVQESRGQIVQTRNIISLADKVFAEIRAYESGSAGNKDFHFEQDL